MKLPPIDQQAHAWAAMATTLVLERFMPLTNAMAMAAALWLAKEVVWDHLLKRGTPEARDLWADLAGIAAAAIVIGLT